MLECCSSRPGAYKILSLLLEEAVGEGWDMSVGGELGEDRGGARKAPEEVEVVRSMDRWA